ncbi:transmembrane protein 236 [Tachysurus fulvidraco]|uniref:transmembrane protein 236 n=1 Tax=Tachysurus fulvidraco TaxID=1234273 RepID=UPI000F4D728A|nr:transmembrane protein 236 [Tachysurus fulvidraco]
MGSGSRIKFAICEVLQFAAFCVPFFIVMQRFAFILAQAKRQMQPSGGNSSMAYWLIISSSIAYLTTVALLVWLPIKYMVFMKKKALVGRKKWRPVALAYVLLSTLPTFAFLIASSEVQIRNNMQFDTFPELPVSLVLFSLILVDIVERIRHCRLTGRVNEVHRNADIPTLSHIEMMMPIATTATVPSPAAASTIVGQIENGARATNGHTTRLPGRTAITGLSGNGMVSGLPANEAITGIPVNTTGPAVPNNGAVPVLSCNNQRQPYIIPGICPSTSLPLGNLEYGTAYTGPLRFLLASDVRAEAFADSFLFWLDTAEMVRVVNHTSVYFSGWALPVYLLSYLSMLRLALMPHSPLLSPLGVALQDLPFLVLRVALLAIFGFVTPILFVMKNLLVCLAYIYFNFMTKLKFFNTERMF